MFSCYAPFNRLGYKNCLHFLNTKVTIYCRNTKNTTVTKTDNPDKRIFSYSHALNIHFTFGALYGRQTLQYSTICMYMYANETMCKCA